MNRKIELLAPAGSLESMYAAYQAGADAVYTGGTLFGARAYADNLQQEQLLEAIDYAHLHGRRLYLTVNTLLKEQELETKLYDYLLPFYRQGLDAVIVQDFGVLGCLRQWFPDLAIHASTQMTVTGSLSAARLESLGVTRLVTPRELSLQELRSIRAQTSLEIESFVHGALCYCYSGQCLFSGMAGGRSGNRGRCAQPCRMAYTVSEKGRCILPANQGYILSPKDLNTIELLPQILEAGVDSLKIEGRMKKPEYTAGVVSIYRKYLDRCLERGAEGFCVSEEDKKHLFDLFNRKGFTQGYYEQHNGSSMITFGRPDFRKEDEAYQAYLRETYIGRKLKENIKGTVRIFREKPAILSVSLGDIAVLAEGETAAPAQSRPLTGDAIYRQMDRLGDTDYRWGELQVQTDGQSFYPLGRLNELRRSALEELTGRFLAGFRRSSGRTEPAVESGRSSEPCGWSASVETPGQLERVLEAGYIGTVILDSHIGEPGEYAALAARVHAAGKQCFLALPRVLREENSGFWEAHAGQVIAAGFDGMTAAVPEAVLLAREVLKAGKVLGEASLYVWNRRAKELWHRWGCDFLTLPPELNARELAELAAPDMQLTVYARVPMMVSAQCIHGNINGCDGRAARIVMTDRMEHHFPVKNYCRECYNIIYNDRPLSLADQWKTVQKLAAGGLRLSFTTENGEETARVLALYGDMAARGFTDRELKERTKGHFLRGTE